MAKDNPLNVDSNYINMMEVAIQREILKEVQDHVKALVQPEVDKMVRQIASKAVRNWTVQYREQKSVDIFDMKTDISIRFVENIIRTEYKENDIRIKVEKEI